MTKNHVALHAKKRVAWHPKERLQMKLTDIKSENIEVYISFSKPIQRNGQNSLSEYCFKRQEMAYAGWCRNFLPFVNWFPLPF